MKSSDKNSCDTFFHGNISEAGEEPLRRFSSLLLFKNLSKIEFIMRHNPMKI